MEVEKRTLTQDNRGRNGCRVRKKEKDSRTGTVQSYNVKRPATLLS